MVQSLSERYPEAFEKGEYKTKEILEKANISRKVLDRYKNKHTDFFKSQVKRIGDKGAIYYDPIIMCIAYEIRTLRDKGLENKEIENSLKATFNISKESVEESKGNSKRESNTKTEETIVSKAFYEKEIKEDLKETKGNLKGNLGKFEILFSDHLKEVFELKLQLKDKDVLLAESKGEVKTLQTAINGLEKNIFLLEAPRNREINNSFTKKDVIVFIISIAFLFLFSGFIWMYDKYQIDLANFF